MNKDNIENIKISKNTVSTKIIVVIILINILAWMIAFNVGYLNLENTNITIITLPIIVMLTLVIHELIHVEFFKIFSMGKAKIEMKIDRDIGAILVLQKNTLVSYTKIAND